ncbi:MAG TPA: alpha/beta hydrolase [Burkholderiales bacterium]|nr:alpha/beta hydrolase [Burkholderiales bacterium]
MNAVIQQVILAHGLWVPGLVMKPLAARLKAAGLRCHSFAYMGRARPLEAHAERLARFAREIGPAHFVGHSLGGLVILQALGAEPALEVGRVVLMGTPARGCLAGRRFGRHAFGRWFLGESRGLWVEGRAARWERREALGVMAGTIPLGLGRCFGALPGPNDGVVTVEETAVQGMTEQVVLPMGHSQLIFSARAACLVAGFIKEGRFAAPAR